MTPDPEAAMTDVSRPPGLRGLTLRIGYDSGDSALHEFYIPALSRAVAYDRSVGFFRASAIAAAAKGVSRFIAGGGRMRLLIGAELSEAECSALIGAREIPPDLAARLARELVAPDEIAARRLEVLAWLAKQKRLEVKVAVPVDANGDPLPVEAARPFFHEKIGILRDAYGDGVAFQGSANESESAWTKNFESFSVYKSWDASAPYFDEWASKFERRWRGQATGFKVFELPEAVHRALLALAPEEPPPLRDPEESPEEVEPQLLAHFLLVAPRLVGASGLALHTTGLSPFPHQLKVVERLAGTYPRSWLVADEVGLGKTISAGLALRRLVLSGQVRRALILAPASVCRQWQDELFEKLGLWVPRLEKGSLLGAHPDSVRELGPQDNPYEKEDILIVSSHLARRPKHQEWIMKSPPLDLLIVDEAHHARRRPGERGRYRPSRLLELLDRITKNSHTRTTWLLTATPMQIALIELIDLLRHVGLPAPLWDEDEFERFYQELSKHDDSTTDWALLARHMPETAELDEAEKTLLAGIEDSAGPIAAEDIKRFGPGASDATEIPMRLRPKQRRFLRAWIRQRGPIGRLVTRHTRRTLKCYRQMGLLSEPLADRDVQLVSIDFSQEERRLYDDLDEIFDSLMKAHQGDNQAAFVLTIYRRRLTSSWSAIAATIDRRLRRMRGISDDQLEEEDDQLEEEVDPFELDLLEDARGNLIDDTAVLRLTPHEQKRLKAYLEYLKRVPDSKLKQLQRDINEARGAGRSVVVFTAYKDTLTYLRDKLRPVYGSQLATYTGQGAQIWNPKEKTWQDIAKSELIEALNARRVSMLLATDAASEGLNLQAASYLVNYDLPWNPMKLEQRIGRIDRLGQQAPTIVVRNYLIPGTVEDAVYRALADRINLFSDLLGKLQPILGATEETFARIYRAPRSRRSDVQQQEIEQLLAKLTSLQQSPVDLDEDEDPWPDPGPLPSPVTLTDLRQVVVEDLGIDLYQPGRPATFDPELVSRDPQRWCALATYGHPRLEEALTSRFGRPEQGLNGALAFAQVKGIWSIYRADRTPPSRVESLADLQGLGAATAAEEAQQRALQEAREAAQSREDAYSNHWLNSMRDKFKALVREAVQAYGVLQARATNNRNIQPREVWRALTLKEGGWKNLDSLRQHLHLEVAAVLSLTPLTDNGESDKALEHRLKEAERQLNCLARKWIARHHTDGP